MKAVRCPEAPKIDGKLDDAVWLAATPVSDFVQQSPQPMAAVRAETEVWMLYDDQAIYVAARLYDSAPDSILTALSERDDYNNSEIFGFNVDAFQDNLNGNAFVVSSANVQVDEKITSSGSDTNWDAVWLSATSIDDKGWTVEMKIPFAALRFPNQDVQKWNVNFFRHLRRHREDSWWSPIDPKINGFFNQFGEVTGIQDVQPPTRLFFYPYVSSTYDHYRDPQEGSSQSSTRFSGGMDLKYGINDAFTLDMTLVPDFGNVRSDNQVLNLSPFEVRFDENRQFFTEGTELFGKGGLFYSRRVGSRPLNFYDVEDQLAASEEIVRNPIESQLLNASKISGRTKGNLGIGFFNAVVAGEHAIVRDTISLAEREIQTSPLSNYNVVVFDQGLKNNSALTFINTNANRFDGEYDANVLGGLLELNNKKGSYGIGLQMKYNKKYGGYEDEDDDGYTYGLALKKISGNFTGEIYQYLESHEYDPNDLGFLFNNNERGLGTYMAYNIFDPFWVFNRFQGNINIQYTRLDKPNAFSGFYLNPGFWGSTKKFHAGGLWATIQPVAEIDYFESRRDGWKFEKPTQQTFGGWISTDYRKTLALDVEFNHNWFSDDRRHYAIAISPRWRVNDNLLIIYDWVYNNEPLDLGYATTLENEDEDIIFGKRDRKTLVNLIDGAYIFNANMSLGFRVRHYWSRAKYQNFYQLNNEGELLESDYKGLDEDGLPSHDSNFNAFNVDVNYRWQFAPGSELLLTWKNAILSSGEDAGLSFSENFDNLWDQAQNNSFTLRILYFLDYNQLKRSKKKSPLSVPSRARARMRSASPNRL